MNVPAVNYFENVNFKPIFCTKQFYEHCFYGVNELICEKNSFK